MEIIHRYVPSQFGPLRENRQGVMLHYDESSSDAGGLQWFFDPANFAGDNPVSYDFWINDKGEIYRLVPQGKCAWHAGKCRPAAGYSYRHANSAFVGVAIAAKHTDKVTPAQLTSVVALCTLLGTNNGWPLENSKWITGHNVQAWPRGRKDDPEGPNPKKHVTLSVEEVRRLVSTGK